MSALNEELKQLRQLDPLALFFVARSRNQWVVVYEANADRSKPVNVYWRDTVVGAKVELSMPERQLAYGVITKEVTGPDADTTVFALSIIAVQRARQFKDRPVLVSFDKVTRQPVARAVVNGKNCVLERVWVQLGLKFSFTSPVIDYIDLYGVNEQGELECERVQST